MKPYKRLAVSFYDSKKTPSLKQLEQIRLMFLGLQLELTFFVSTPWKKNLHAYPNECNVSLIERTIKPKCNGINKVGQNGLNRLASASYGHWLNSVKMGAQLVQGAAFETVLMMSDNFEIRKGLRDSLMQPIEPNFLFVPDQFKFQYPLLFLPSYHSNVCDPATFYKISTLWKNFDNIELEACWGNFLSRFETLEINSIDFCEHFDNYVWYFWNTNQGVYIRQYKDYWVKRERI